MLFKGSVPESFVALTEIVDKHGNDAIIAIHINKKYGRSVINKIASVYSKTDNQGKNNILSYVNRQIEAGNLVDASNKKATKWFTSRGLQLPKLVQTILDANTIISNSAENVKGKNENENPKGKRLRIKDTVDGEYISAVEKGDTETAQRMVDKAAYKDRRIEYCVNIQSAGYITKP